MPLKGEFPEEGELIVCKVIEVTQFAAWCELLEYKLKGIIPISEAAGKWIFDVREVIKEGQVVVARVMRIEKENKLVHLSLRRVSQAEMKEKMNEFRREQRGEKLLELACNKVGVSLEEGYRQVGFLLIKKFGSLFDAFCNMDREKLERLQIDKNWIDALLEMKEKSIKEKETVLKYELEVKSLEPNGVELIKEFLLDLEEKTKGKIYYISSPFYRLEITTKEPKKDERRISKILEKMSSDKVSFSYRRIG